MMKPSNWLLSPLIFALLTGCKTGVLELDNLQQATGLTSKGAAFAITEPTSLTFVAASGLASFLVSGTCNVAQANQSVKIAGAATGSATCLTTGTWNTRLDLTGVLDGATTLTADITDSTGLAATQASVTFQIDTVTPTAPALTIQGGAPYATSSAVTLSPSAVGADQMYITNTAGCGSGGTWNTYTTSVQNWTLGQLNSTATVYSQFRDFAGNTTACVSASIIHDGIAPTSPTLSIAAGVSTTTSATVALTLSAVGATDMYITNTAGCTSGGSWEAYATSKAGWLLGQTNSTAAVYVLYKDVAGNTSACTSDTIIEDDTAPVLTASEFTLNSGATSATNFNIAVNLKAVDSATNITHFCLKYNTLTAPTAGDACWTSVSAPSPGLTPAQTLTLSSYYFPIGLIAGSYSVYAYAKDAAGNISILSNAGAGTLGKDKQTISYDPGTPPIVSNILVSNTDSPSNPPSGAELTTPSGTDVYIKWTATDSEGLSAHPIAIYYTTNDLTYTLIQQSLDNTSNGGCTVDSAGSSADDSATGCYLWSSGAPSNGYYRIKIQITDAANMTASATSVPLNIPKLKILAGNTDPGLGNHALGAMFFSDYPSESGSDPNTLLVASNGTIYFLDYSRGILYIDPLDGVVRLLIARDSSVASTTGDGGPVTSAKLKIPQRMVLGFDNKIYVWDSFRIRAIDLSASPISIDTVIGGGGDTSDTVSDARDLSMNSTPNRNSPFIALPNGVIYFQSEYTTTPATGLRVRKYDPTANPQITSFKIGGTGRYGNAASDISTQTVRNIGFAYNPSDSAIIDWLAVVADNSSASFYYARLDTSGQSVGAGTHPTLSGTLYVHYMVNGRDGNLYTVSRAYGTIYRYNPGTVTFTKLLGTGTRGTCTDGTLATSCATDIQDAFITATGKIYFMDQGLVRTIDDSGNVQTIAGQRYSYGDSGMATSARFGRITSISTWNNHQNITILDRQSVRFREVTGSTGIINTIAGNGFNSVHNTTALANTQAIYVSSSGVYWDDFVASNTTGDIYFSREKRVAKLTRSTGYWSDIAGGGGTLYSVGDGTTGLNVGLQNYPPKVIGYNGTHVAINVFSYINPNSIDGLMKLYDLTDSNRQSHLAGAMGNISSVFSADTTALSSCTVPNASGYFTPLVWDSVNNYWLALSVVNTGVTGTNAIRILPPGGNISTLTTLSTNVLAFDYYKNGGTETIYTCRQDGKLGKKIVGGAETSVTLPGSMTCVGTRLFYDSANDAVIFIFQQNSLYGVAQYSNL